MWAPTHVQVTVLRARNLLIKGKNGTNDTFVTIQLGKDKYQTSTIEKSNSPEWNEQCDMLIPDMNSSVMLTVQHKNFLGIDEFLGQLTLPLNEFDIYDRPRNKWFPLHAKPGKSKEKDQKNRGELEVRTTFYVKSKSTEKDQKNQGELEVRTTIYDKNLSDSCTNLNKKYKRTSSLKSMASTVGQKMRLPRSLSFKDSKVDILSRSPPVGSSDIKPEKNGEINMEFRPAVSSPTRKEENLESFALKQPDLLRRSLSDIRGSRITPLKELQEHHLSLPYMEETNCENLSRSNEDLSCSGQLYSEEMMSTENLTSEEKSFLRKNRLHASKDNARRHTVQGLNIPDFKSLENYDLSRTNSQRTLPASIVLPQDVITKYGELSKEELLYIVSSQKMTLDSKEQQIRELESYIDNLLVRVMETTPRILQKPFKNSPRS